MYYKLAVLYSRKLIKHYIPIDNPDLLIDSLTLRYLSTFKNRMLSILAREQNYWTLSGTFLIIQIRYT